MGRPFKKMCDFLGIKGVKPLHGFRSTAISNLLDNGVSPRIVQKLARHTKIETTLSYHNDTNLQIAPQITGLI
jgi:integrase